MATLTGIRIKNFKAVGETPVELKLAPITLLYGPNGAGKSTVLHALHYAREILERGNLDPDRTLAGGELDLGGFRNLVHGRDLDREIVLGFDLDIGGGLPSFEFVEELDPRDAMGFSVDGRRLLAPDRVFSAGIELTLAWSNILERPFVRRYAVDLEGRRFAEIGATPDLKNAVLGNIDFDHPILDAGREEHFHLAEDEFGGTIEGMLFGDAIMPVIGVHNSVGALPSLEVGLDLDFPTDPFAEVNFRNLTKGTDSQELELARLIQRERNAVAEWLSRIIAGPAVLLRDLLVELIPIGPIRAVPQRGFRPQASTDPARWASGLAAWDRLAAMDQVDVMQVDHWLAERLDSGFGLRVERVKYASDSTAFAALFAKGVTLDDLEWLPKAWNDLPERVHIALYSTANGLDVEPSDIGVGISQIVPVVVAALDPDAALVSVEQPELHVHPKLQTELGDLFAFAVDRSGQPRSPLDHLDRMLGGRGRTLLIETHSEHLVLRLLRRIREAGEGNAEPGAPPVSTETISVNYVQPVDGGVRMHHLRVDETGEFVDRWPEGFFAERRKELF